MPPTREAGPGERRLFIAVPVPDGVRDRVGSVVETARADAGAPRGVRWVGPDGLHLTLRFLGATPEGRVTDAASAVAEAARFAPQPFEVRLDGTGTFPGASAPRVLWLGIDAGGAELAALARALDASLAARGWPSDPRPFRPHLTLARCEDPSAGRAAAAALAAASAGLRAGWRAGSLVLYESHLGRGPARYAVVAEARLGT
ncbi:MAG: RNA 2',3'-cyclic phosphodiesterase [Chloroflexi bacterium]|nr:RNA 2',3'-cyclic phosphodiesterase [Chloroflexota bacterium]